MYAVIETGGKQYRVSVGDVIEVEKLSAEVGDKVDVPVLMTADGDKVTTGDANAKATVEVLGHGKSRKTVVFKYKPKKNERKKNGHRQQFSRVKIVAIA